MEKHVLFRHIPKEPTDSNLLDAFLEYVAEKNLELYPAQEEAILTLFEGKNVILNTPTGSGKSLVATALHFRSIALRRRSIYTCPIKALVNEKFLALCREFGPEHVGMVTGDASVNKHAPIICCTAEILSNIALREGSRAEIHDIIMDEFHYYSDRERGVAWQIPLLTLPQCRFLLMSATLGDTSRFEEGLTKLTGQETVVVRSTQRPVPLDFIYSENPLHETIGNLVNEGKAPIYVVNFTQREAAEEAQNFLSVDYSTKEEKRAISDALEGFRFSSPYGKEIQRLLKHGVGIHHAGLLPKYRVLVEKLAQKGLLKIICGTDTLGVGVNVPIRTVVFTKLCKFDGEKTTILSVRDFQQISGRAGRRGFDDRGTVVVQAPEHVIENIRLDQKIAADPRKKNKIVKKKPPEKGFLPWDRNTFHRLITAQPEQLTSRFAINHSMLLNVLSRGNDGCDAMRRLVQESHETDVTKKRLRNTAFQYFRSLVDRNIIEVLPRNHESGQKLRLNVDLQEDFTLHHALSLYLIDTVKPMDPFVPGYVLDLLSVVESVVENPEIILRKQLDRIKREKMEELKFQGIPFEERIEKLDQLEYPKPNREFIYETFNAFAAKHPWVGENIRPKSVAREMYENFMSFDEYIREYELQRSEGLLLRYLSEVYKTLVQTVPEYSKSDEVYTVEEYFGTMIGQVDSSLLDEWQRMRHPERIVAEVEHKEEKVPEDITRDKRSFTVLIRNEIFRIVRALAAKKYQKALEYVQASKFGEDKRWVSDELAASLAPFYESHQYIGTDQAARGAQNTIILPAVDKSHWKVQQILTDPDGLNDWVLDLTVDLDKSRAESRVILHLDGVGPV